MAYHVPCECGVATAVTAGQAGGEIVCVCGRTVAVPLLSQLRRSVGEPTSPTPELTIPALLSTGVVPGPPGCAGCGGPAKPAEIAADCERPVEEREGVFSLLARFLLIILFGWTMYIFLRTQNRPATTHGRDVQILLRLRLCFDCRTRATARSIAAAVRAVPEYAGLLAKYPTATLTLLPDSPPK